MEKKIGLVTRAKLVIITFTPVGNEAGSPGGHDLEQ